MAMKGHRLSTYMPAYDKINDEIKEMWEEKQRDNFLNIHM